MGIWAFWSQSQMVYSANIMQPDFCSNNWCEVIFKIWYQYDENWWFVLQYLFSFGLIVILNVFTVSDIRGAWKDASKICNMILRFPCMPFIVSCQVMKQKILGRKTEIWNECRRKNCKIT